MPAPDREWPGREYPLADGTTQRIALMVEYNGHAFHGWQRQASPAVATVQSALDSALAVIAGHDVKTYCAGRTDAGVHALAQLVHVDVVKPHASKAWVQGVNSHLPRSVRVRWAEPVSTHFHARYSALSRQYKYYIDNRPTPPAIFNGQLTHFRYPLDAGLMHSEAQCLLGERDFSAFRAAACQSQSSMRYVDHIAVQRCAERVCLTISANAFLLHMVRNIAGSLMAVGSGKYPAGWLADVLAGGDRNQAEATAPPDGLYLQRVVYPVAAGLPACEGELPFAQ